MGYLGQVGLAPPAQQQSERATMQDVVQDGETDVQPEAHSTSEDDGSEDEGEDGVSEEDIQHAEHIAKELASPKFITTVEGRGKVLEHAELDKYGRKVIDIPVGIETMESARKAPIYLRKQQSAHTARCPNPVSNPRYDVPLRDAITEYECSPVYTRSLTGTTRTTTCSIRDPYTDKLFDRIISFTWRMLAPLKQRGKRAYNATHRFQHIRGHL
ncbi:hypothetical protein BGZ54_000240 [Gamsiella multidivaricata]|nr:hypothetical protein BGZ54_000240 [Gamsiella multidivaricata]